VSREMVKWRRYINHNKQKQLWDLTFVTRSASGKAFPRAVLCEGEWMCLCETFGLQGIFRGTETDFLHLYLRRGKYIIQAPRPLTEVWLQDSVPFDFQF
jgi:hypothetical protein